MCPDPTARTEPERPSLAQTDPADTLDPAVRAQQQRLEARLFGEPHEPVHVGRFALLRVLGAGAMGVVHLAYDEVLDRKIAIKLIQCHPRRGTEPQALLREAQAMARVSHANVVQVYEAGEYARGVFVAMELVRGKTLRAWLDEDGPQAPWTERLRMVSAAGHGLAEAHQVGVVHRDFKPDNVMVTERGEPKVTDFGLAGMARPDSALDQTPTNLGQLSCTTGVGGTPLYMAPEVFEGRPADARSDQFSFCVVAYEALFGQRPFEGDSFAALCLSVTEGEPKPVSDREVPAAIANAVLRGLHVDPEQRWPSMEALLEALAPPPARGRSWLLGAAAVGGLAAAAALAWPQDEESPCGDARAHLQGVWDEERRAEVQAALTSSDAPFAADTWAQIAPRLDDYGERWAEQRTQACTLTRVHHEQSEENLALRRTCLDRARLHLDASIDALQRADPDTVANANELVDRLPSLDRCEDVVALQLEVPPPDEDERERVDRIEAILAEAEVQQIAGAYQRSLDRAEEARTLLEDLRYGPVQPEVWLAIARAQQGLIHDDEAETSLLLTEELALTHGRWSVAFQAAVQLAMLLGQGQSRFVEAHNQLRVAKGLLEHAPSVRRRADYHQRRAVILQVEARYEEALDEYRTARQLLLDSGDDGRNAAALFRLDLGSCLKDAGRLEESEAELRAAIDEIRELFGPRHPKVVQGIYLLGCAISDHGRYEDGLALIDEALSLGEEVMPDHHRLAQMIVGKAAVLEQLGRCEEPMALLEKARARWEPELGEHDQLSLWIRAAVGGVLMSCGRVDEAEEHIRATLRGQTVLYGADHPSTAMTRRNLGTNLYHQGRYDEAVRQHRAALDALQQRLGTKHEQVARVRISVADSLSAQGHNEAAIFEYRTALPVLAEKLGERHPSIAFARNNLGIALQALERYDEAEVEYRAAVAGAEEALPEDHPALIILLTNVGTVQTKRGDARGAMQPLERAVGMLERVETTPANRANARKALAVALHETGDDPRRMRELAESALADYRTVPPETLDDEIEILERLLARG